MIYVNARAIIERGSPGAIEVIVQRRTKPGQTCYAFPGGQVRPFESLLDALIREVKEETGLDVIETCCGDTYIRTGEDRSFSIECFRPYAVYQTVQGPVDSMGVYVKCKAIGEIVSHGDDTEDVRWISPHALRNLLERKNAFSDIDRAAAMYSLKNG